MKRRAIILYLACLTITLSGQITLTGHVYDEYTNAPIPFATVQLFDTEQGVITNEEGKYIIDNLPPGEYILKVSYLGYKTVVTEAVFVRWGTKMLDVSMEKQTQELNEFTVKANPFLKKIETPLSFRRISPAEIEFNPGANRDISKVVQSYPGVAASTSFRNDLIVRGGGPAENVYYLEGIEIPNLNHFATQGASGGPVGIINADLIREVEFLSGAFPVTRGDAMSSVLNFKIVDGSEKRHTKIGFGASEASLGLEGMIGEKSNYVISIRRSYLQFLFSVLELPFLPTFTDFTIKIENKLSKNNELTFLSIGAYDINKLNLNATDTEETAYTLSTIPYQTQWNYTIGAVYKHYFRNSYMTLVLSKNHLYNYLYKYLENQNDNPEQQILDYKSNEDEIKTRVEYIIRKGSIKYISGISLEYAKYDNTTFKKRYINNTSQDLDYKTNLSFIKYALFEQASYTSANNLMTVTMGIRLDGNTYSAKMQNPLQQFSPRAALSLQLAPDIKLNMASGRFHQLPAYTTLGYRNNSGKLINKQNDIAPISSTHFACGFEWTPFNYTQFSVEGFYKKYRNYPMSTSDSVSLASKGAGYDLYGDEEVISSSDGRAYGVEVLGRWSGHKGVNIVLAYTWVNSEFTDLRSGDYLPSSWDNKHILSLTASKKLPEGWNAGLKFRLQGGAPYTPYDEDKSSLTDAWDASGVAYLDYSQYNSQRLTTFTQLDIRVDKNFYFEKWMLALYLDVQNALGRKYKNAPKLIRASDDNGNPIIENPEAPDNEQRYVMKYITTTSGTILPTIGIMVEF